MADHLYCYQQIEELIQHPLDALKNDGLKKDKQFMNSGSSAAVRALAKIFVNVDL